MRNLTLFGTWTTVDRSSVNKKIASTRWVFAINYGTDGRIDRFRAGLVVRGFKQAAGQDFESTFAPVIRFESLRMLFAIAAMHHMKSHLLDATNAFVGSPLDIPNYINIPGGLEGFQPSLVSNGKQVLLLRRSLYGLKQAAYLWNKKINEYIKKMNFKQSSADPSVYINSRGVIIAVYVDDIFQFLRNQPLTLNWLKEACRRSIRWKILV